MTAMEERGVAGDKLYSPSAARNAAAIAAAFGDLSPTPESVLEIASGTGEHAARVCAGLRGLRWQPTEPDDASRRSIKAWAADVADGRMAAPLRLDVTEPDWPAGVGGPYDLLFCANMIHIAPWAATEGLFAGAGRVLSEGGSVLLYGPFSRRGAMAPSNEAFDGSLKARDPAWGVRDLDDRVQPLAARFGFVLTTVRPMPANNLIVRFERN